MASVGERRSVGGTDHLLRSLWDDRMKRGDFFFYNLTREELDRGTRRTRGLHRFVVQLNTKRGTKKRRGLETR